MFQNIGQYIIRLSQATTAKILKDRRDIAQYRRDI